MTTSNQKPSAENNPSPTALPKLSSSDILFVGFITAGLSGGVLLILLELPALAPSLFFGLAVSSLVHRYLGGIRPSDASITTGIGKLGGALASLVLTTVIFNSVLEKQMENLVLSVDPKEHDLVVLDRDTGKAVNILISGKDGLNSGQKPIQINLKALEDIKRLCRQGEGFCKDPALDAEFTVNPALKQGFARVCTERNDLNGYPLVIGRGDVTDLKNIPKLSRVKAYADLDCPTGMSNNSLLIEISKEDAEKVNIGNGNEGFAFMPGLNDASRPPSLFNSNVDNRKQPTL